MQLAQECNYIKIRAQDLWLVGLVAVMSVGGTKSSTDELQMDFVLCLSYDLSCIGVNSKRVKKLSKVEHVNLTIGKSKSDKIQKYKCSWQFS